MVFELVQELIRLGSGITIGVFYALVVMGALVGREFLKRNKEFVIILGVGGAVNYFLALAVQEIIVHFLLGVSLVFLSVLYFAHRKGWLG